MKKIKICFVLILIAQASLAQIQTTETINVQSKVFNEVRKVKVSLPPEYNDYPSRKYIVAYLFDAQSDDLFNYIKATIDYLTAEGYIKPLILVGISSGNRQYEFTPKSETEQGLKYFQKSGGADLLALHVKDEVLPDIQKRFRCNSYNIGIGHSLGATFVTYCLIKYPEIFNATIAISPNFHYDNEQIVHKFDSLTNVEKLFNKFLYIAYGKDDTYEDRFKPGTQKMDSVLIKKKIAGLKWQVKSLDNDSHGTTAAEGIFKGLLALYRQFTLSDKQINVFYHDTKRSFIDNVKEYYKSQSGWAHIQLPIVDDINNIGYNCMYAGKNKEAIEVFIWALSLYPDDSNLYDSMGEIQQNTGNKKEALNYYSKGLDIVKHQKSKVPIKTYAERIKWFNGRIKSVNNPK
jgi:predicted alpha/beta superfamily hydrolase